MVEFAINSSVSDSTKHAPFELNYGYMPYMLIAGNCRGLISLSRLEGPANRSF
jgi:hypothetical protein